MILFFLNKVFFTKNESSSNPPTLIAVKELPIKLLLSTIISVIGFLWSSFTSAPISIPYCELDTVFLKI